jgi:hypothetical protein
MKTTIRTVPVFSTLVFALVLAVGVVFGQQGGNSTSGSGGGENSMVLYCIS